MSGSADGIVMALSQRGFALAEVMVGTIILATAFLALGAGLQLATAAIHGARAETLAAFLAEERVEQLRAVALADWADPALTPGVVTEDYGTLTLAPHHRRETILSEAPDAGCAGTCRLLTVRVSFRLAIGWGLGGGRAIVVHAMLVARA